MKYFYSMLFLFIPFSAYSKPNVSFNSDCIITISTDGLIHYINLKNIKRIFESNNGTKLDFDEIRIRDISNKDKKDIINRFVNCSG